MKQYPRWEEMGDLSSPHNFIIKLIVYLIFRKWELGFNGTNLIIISKKKRKKD